jgi:hypothetical protein
MNSIISKHWESKNKEIDYIKIECINDIIYNKALSKIVVLPIGTSDVLVKIEIELLKSCLEINENFSVLEIGAGIGNFCKIFQEQFKVKEYTLLDTPSMLRISKFFLDFYKVSYKTVSTDEYKILYGKKFDLCVSNMCFSELPKKYTDDLLKNVVSNCFNTFIVDTTELEFRKDLCNKLLSYSKFENLECAGYKDFYLSNHGVYFACRNN